MIDFVFPAFLFGLLSSLHCVGMCGAVSSLFSARGLGTGTRFHLARVASYAAMGTVLGASGQALGHILPRQLFVVMAIASWLLGAFGLLGAPLPRVLAAPLGTLFERGRRAMGALGPSVGAVFCLMPCGVLGAAYGFALASQHAWIGGLSMLAFGLATVPPVALTGLCLKWVMRHPNARRFAAVAMASVAVFVEAPKLFDHACCEARELESRAALVK